MIALFFGRNDVFIKPFLFLLNFLKYSQKLSLATFSYDFRIPGNIIKNIELMLSEIIKVVRYSII